jgi:hypothetical protein
MSLQTRLSDLITAIGTDYKTIRTWITGSSTGTLASLTTTDKTSLVAALNEVKAGSTGSPPSATTAVQGVIEIATLAEVATGTDTTRAVTAEGVRQERAALKTEILGAGVPAALDTLDELAAALADDANFASTVTTSLAGKQPLDADLTAIAALDASTSGAIASDGSGWVKKTYAQFKTALSLVKGDVGLGNVDNTSDVNKPVSTAQQTALDGKQPLDSDLTAIAALTSAADKVPYSTGAGAWAMATQTAFARTLIDDADAATARATLAVYSTTELGDPETDLAALYATAKT